MKMLAAAGLFAGLSVLAGAALAEDAPKPPKEKKICRSLEVTGSILPHTTCHTKAEWAQVDAANASGARRALDQQRDPSGAH